MKTEQYIMVSGKQTEIKDMVGVYKYGPMVVDMKDIGKEIKLM